MILDENTRLQARVAIDCEFHLPCFSTDRRSCAVAIVAEAKANDTPSALSAARAQWSSVAYLQIMDRISIAREAPYADDENICQYGYLICGLVIIILKMSLRLNKAKRRQSDVLNEYFSFPIDH